jgi:hypothetical protein
LEGAGVAIFGIAFWGMGFNSHERDYFKEKVIRRFVRRPAKQIVVKSESNRLAS